ncbi:hypothetical protein VCEC0012_001022A, partial [Vibrio cholerae O1 str. EC-0012]
MEGDGFEPSKA